MELLNRYLNAVKFWLPKEQQEDILKELTENIRSQMEDREGELGRPLNETEQSAILKKHGHPMVVASRYREHQHLIGPTFFPIYWLVVRIAVAASVGGYVVSQVALATAGKPAAGILEGLLQSPGIALTSFAWVTLVFAAIDWGNSKFGPARDWDPRSLREVAEKARKGARRNPIFELVGWLVGIAWWAAIPSFPFLVFGPAVSFLRLTPVWQDIHLPVLLILLVPLALEAGRGMRPDWKWLGPVAQLGRTLASLAIVSILLKAGNLVTVSSELATHKSLGEIVQVSVTLGLAVVSVICVGQLLFQIIGLIRTGGRGAFPVLL